MQVKVYEIAWGETVTSSGPVSDGVVTYSINFSNTGPQGPVGPPGPQGPQGPAGVASWNDLVGKPSTFTPSAHTHPISEVTNLQTALDGKASVSHTHGNMTNDGKVGTTAGLPLKTGTAGVIEAGAFGTNAGQFSEGNHTHAAATTTVAGFMSASDKSKLDGIAAGAEVNVNADWDATSGDAQILNKPSTFPPSSHTHPASQITGLPVELVIACSDETSNLTVGANKATFRAPYAFTLTGVRASVNTAPTGSTLIVDINKGLVSILSTKLSVDANETTSTTAATPALISDASIPNDAEIAIDLDQIGSSTAGKGLKVVLIGTRA